MTTTPAGVTDAVPASVPAPAPLGPGRLGPWFAALWLFFLADPLLAAFRERDTLAGDVGVALTLAFAVVYMSVWLSVRRDRMFIPDRPAMVRRAAVLVLLTALGAGMVVTIGEEGLTCLVYLAVTAVMTFPLRVAAGLVLTAMALAVAAGGVDAWGSQLGLAFSTMAASIAVLGIRAMITRNHALLREQQKNAELAVENERTRFARDLHDILGHSLTVITVKAELAQRLVEVDVDRARAELADLERLSRDALADVRRAVEGYRELTLPGELARARNALGAAEIEPVLPNSTDEVPTDLREVFAWAVREGVTNVIRHSDASRCEVLLAADRVEVRDDGAGPGGSQVGSGLTGLRERAAAVGATLVIRDLGPGFSVAVVRP